MSEFLLVSAGLYVPAERQTMGGAGGAYPHRAATSSSLPSSARVSVRERRPHSGEPVADSADVLGEQRCAESPQARHGVGVQEGLREG